MKEKKEDNTYTQEIHSMYCYKGTNVFKNTFHIHDKDLLEKQEALLVTFQTSKLMLSDKCSPQERKLYRIAKSNNFDVEQYLAIHKFLFGGIYPEFAGKIRSEDISKGGITFCTHFNIYSYLNDELNKFKSNILHCNTVDEFLNCLAYSYGEINMVHPFNEGNGRTQREFFRQFVEFYSKKLGFGEFTLDYSIMKDKPELHDDIIKGSIQAGVRCEYGILKYVLENILVEKNQLLNRGNKNGISK